MSVPVLCLIPFERRFSDMVVVTSEYGESTLERGGRNKVSSRGKGIDCRRIGLHMVLESGGGNL